MWLAVALSLPSLVPLLATLASLTRPDADTLRHLTEYVLPQVGVNTLWLLLGVGLGTAVLGTALAALVALCEFPGRRLFAWARVLPLKLQVQSSKFQRGSIAQGPGSKLFRACSIGAWCLRFPLSFEF